MSTIEQQIQASGKTAPRITPSDIQAAIDSVHFFRASEGVCGAHPNANQDPTAMGPLSLLTICVIVLKNGFTVIGKSGVASPENFDVEIGRTISRQNAEREIWPLLGYQLCDRLHEDALAGQDALI